MRPPVDEGVAAARSSRVDVARSARWSRLRVAGRRLVCVAAVLAAGCGAPAATPAPAAIYPASAARPAWQVRPPGGTRPIDPGITGVNDHGATLLDAEGCAGCHPAIAAEWATSRHALAWTNGIFQREYAARPLPWCVNCHAPLTTQQAGRFRERGVDCATCHVRGGALVSARRRPGSPHATIEEASFGSPAYCADCHQFTFPVLTPAGEVARMTPHPMQTTVASFAAGPYAGERDGCMACHGSRTNHAFLGGHDPGMLGAALDVTWCVRPARVTEPVRTSGTSGTPGTSGSSATPAAAGPTPGAAGPTLEVAVRNAAAGHSVPTGDIHRHMNLRVWRSSAPEALFEAYYGRRFEPDDRGGKRTVWDSTIAPGEVKRHALALAELGGDPGRGDEPINLELTYVFLASEQPRPGSAPDEPFTASVVRWRAAPAELPACR